MDSYTITPKIYSSALNYLSDYDRRHSHDRNSIHKSKPLNKRLVCDKCRQVYTVAPAPAENEICVDYYGVDHIPTYGLKHQNCPRCAGVELYHNNFVNRADADRWIK